MSIRPGTRADGRRPRPAGPERGGSPLVPAGALRLALAIVSAATAPSSALADEAASPAVAAPKSSGATAVVETFERRDSVASPLSQWRYPSPEAADRIDLGQRSLPLADILFISRPEAPEAPAPHRVRLWSGDDLAGEVVGGGEERVEIEGSVRPDGPGRAPRPLSVPVDEIELFLVRSAFADTSHLHRALEVLGRGKPRSDLLYLRSQRDPVEGVLDRLDAEGAHFDADRLGELAVGFDKLRALRLAPLEKEPAKRDGNEPGARSPKPTAIFLHLLNGGGLGAELVSVGDGVLVATHEALGRLRVPLADLRQVDFRGGRCRFLSDLRPVLVKEHRGALFAQSTTDAPYYAHKRDRNVLGEPLRMRGRVYAKGIGVHSYSRLEYDLGGAFHRFKVDIGLDDSARPPPGAERPDLAGRVVFRVWLDGERLAQEELTYRDEPRALDLPIAGGRRLAIEVDFGLGDIHLALDRADWAEARLYQ